METLGSKNLQFWVERYSSGVTPWDLGQIAPPIASWFKSGKDKINPGKMAVLGSGYGHDAAFFGQHGFSVTGFDYVQEAVESARQRYGEWAEFIQADIFKLPESYNGKFDYVLEHTCFCAIPVVKRKDYAKLVQRLLKPGGLYMALFWAHSQEDGPPYKTDRGEIESLFNPFFQLESLYIPEDSFEDRKNEELLAVFRKKN